MSGPFQSSGGGGGGLSEAEVDGRIDAKITEYDSTVDTKVGNAIDAAKTEIDGDVDAKIAAVVGTAGAAFDTLGEIQTAIDGKVSKSGDTMTGALSINYAATGVTQSDAPLRVISTDGGSAGVSIVRYANSPSPAAGDHSRDRWYFNNSLGNPWLGGQLSVIIDDPTSGSEDAHFIIATTIGGSLGFRVLVGAGMYGSSLSDMGDNSINFANYYVSGVNMNTAYGASASEVRAQASTSKYLTPANLAQRASFRAHKNGSAQSGLTSSVFTQVTLGTEAWDIGGIFASNGGTPPAGKFRISAALNAAASTNWATNGYLLVSIFKNGLRFQDLAVEQFAAGLNGCSVVGTAIVDSNGTDVFTLHVYADVAAGGTYTVAGSASTTFMDGEQI